MPDAQRGLCSKRPLTRSGFYEFPQLQPGSYTLTISAAGFKTQVRENLTQLVASPAMFNATLSVSSVAETVTYALKHLVTDAHVHVESREIPPVHLRHDRIPAASFRSALQILFRFTYQDLEKIVKVGSGGFLQHGADFLASLRRILSKAGAVLQR